MNKRKLRVAILDLYNKFPNEGMRCLKTILEDYSRLNHVHIIYDVFDVRAENEIADLSYDLYLSTGGPGSPIDSEGSLWETKYFGLMKDIMAYNELPNHPKKYVFLICHSFQIFVRYFELGQVSMRKSTSFGVMTVHKTDEGQHEPLFSKMEDPFWVVDSRDWQVKNANEEKINALGGAVLCIEKFRPHIDLSRAIMAIRFNDYIFGTQFHPEADAVGMMAHLQTDDKREHVILLHGEKKYFEMLDHLDDPDKIMFTYEVIIPTFIDTVLQEQFQHVLK
jgi:GMP synthase-like glutamine amidotransferase